MAATRPRTRIILQRGFFLLHVLLVGVFMAYMIRSRDYIFGILAITYTFGLVTDALNPRSIFRSPASELEAVTLSTSTSF